MTTPVDQTPVTDEVRRIEPVDVLTRDQQTLVLYERGVVQLGPIGAAIFRRTASTPLSVRDLAAALEAEFGPTPEGSTSDATRTAVDDLVRQGVLARVPRSGERS